MRPKSLPPTPFNICGPSNDFSLAVVVDSYLQLKLKTSIAFMSESEFFKTVEHPATAEFKDRGSRFLAFAFPIETAQDFKNRLQELKKEHPKAVHHCFAYRIGSDGNNFRVSDDGEPAGTAGKQLLGQIDSKGLCNVAIIVVRYFGGSLLGVPGLINAYKTVSSLVLQVTPLVRKQLEVKYLIHFDYTRLNELLLVLKQCQCTIFSQEITLFSNLTTGIPKSRHEEVLYRLKEIKGIDVQKMV